MSTWTQCKHIAASARLSSSVDHGRGVSSLPCVINLVCHILSTRVLNQLLSCMCIRTSAMSCPDIFTPFLTRAVNNSIHASSLGRPVDLETCAATYLATILPRPCPRLGHFLNDPCEGIALGLPMLWGTPICFWVPSYLL